MRESDPTQKDCFTKAITNSKIIKIICYPNVDAILASSIFAKFFTIKNKQFHITTKHEFNDEDVVLQLKNDKISEGITPEIILQRGKKILCKIRPVEYNIEPDFASLTLLAKRIVESLGYSEPNFLKLILISGISLGHDTGTLRSLKSNYEPIINALKQQKILSIEKIPLFFGFSAIPLIESMITTLDPYIKGISGNEKTCTTLLTRLGISTKKGDEWRRFIDLTTEERQNLVSAIIEESLMEDEITEFDIVAENYLFNDELEKYLVYDARSYCDLVKTCVYTKRHGEAIVIAMGERGRILRNTQEFVIKYKIDLAVTLNNIISENNITKIAWSHVIEINDKYNHATTIELLEHLKKLNIITGNHPTILTIKPENIVYIATMVQIENELEFMEKIANELNVPIENIQEGLWKFELNDRDPNDVITKFNQHFDKIMRDENYED